MIDQPVPHNHTRDYWRSVIVNEVALLYGLTYAQLEPMAIRFRDMLGAGIRHLLDEMCDQESSAAKRTTPMHVFCIRQCDYIFRAYQNIMKEAA